MEIKDFFIATNNPGTVPDSAYNDAALLVNAAKAFARSSSNCVYIIDYFKQGFLYVSDNLSLLCGQPADKIREFGYSLYIDHVPEAELGMLDRINKMGFQFFQKLPVEERTLYTIFYDFHLKNGTKKKLVNHRLTPMVLTPEGKIWLALCTIAPAARNTAGNVKIKKENSPKYFTLNHDMSAWVEEDEVKLTDLERDVLLLSSQGYTMNEISDKTCRSIDTIKTCKRKLFERLEVKNIAEALSFVANYRLL